MKNILKMSVFSLLLVFLSCDSEDETINNEKINTNRNENSVSVKPKNHYIDDKALSGKWFSGHDVWFVINKKSPKYKLLVDAKGEIKDSVYAVYGDKKLRITDIRNKENAIAMEEEASFYFYSRDKSDDVVGLYLGLKDTYLSNLKYREELARYIHDSINFKKPFYIEVNGEKEFEMMVNKRIERGENENVISVNGQGMKLFWYSDSTIVSLSK